MAYGTAAANFPEDMLISFESLVSKAKYLYGWEDCRVSQDGTLATFKTEWSGGKTLCVGTDGCVSGLGPDGEPDGSWRGKVDWGEVAGRRMYVWGEDGDGLPVMVAGPS